MRYTIDSKYGTFTRTSKREYRFAVVRKDGYIRLSEKEKNAREEYNFQVNRGHEVEFIEIYCWEP